MIITRLIHWLIGKILTESGVGVVLPSGEVFCVAQNGRPTIRFHRWRNFLLLPFTPSLAFGEGYANKTITIEGGELVDTLDCLAAAMNDLGEPRFARLTRRALAPLMILKSGTTQRKSKANVHMHYDLGNDFYRLFLDRDWQYSCAYFTAPTVDLDTAQQNKKDHICAKLQIEMGMEVLDIGCGWGGLALQLAKNHRARVTAVTLSEEQIALARMRAEKESLPVTFHLHDYRDETRLYDRIVSVGMFEHVGKKNFKTYFDQVSRNLKPDGIALIHTIGATRESAGFDPFINKYIFPGGRIPHLSEIMSVVEKTDLKVTDVEVLHQHYAYTLQHWRERFTAKRDEARALFDDRFCRIWELYLAGCELAFRRGDLVVYQIQLMKKSERAPLTRDYLYKSADVPLSAARDR